MSKKSPSGQNLFVLISLVLGIGAGLFGLNYYHALKCTNAPEEKQTRTEAIDRRLKRAEAQILKNNAYLEKMKYALQERLLVIDAAELKEIIRVSEDEAIRIALKAATYPAPPKPEFEEDYDLKEEEYKDSKYDDFFWREGETKIPLPRRVVVMTGGLSSKAQWNVTNIMWTITTNQANQRLLPLISP